MLKTTSLRNMRHFLLKDYRARLKARGEQALDTLLGTMIGVLFLAVITSSFAGVYMAYTITSAKAAENSARASIVSKISTNTLNKVFIDSSGGKAAAQGAGWTVLTQGTTPLSTADTKTNTAFANYTYAATIPLVTGGSTLVSQWGVLETSGPDQGLVKIYTSVPKAGVDVTCNWTQPTSVLSTSCVTVYNTNPSLITPPAGLSNSYPNVNWQASTKIMPWTTTPDYTTATWNTATTQKLGTVNVASSTVNGDGTRTIRFVAMLQNLVPGNKVNIDFYKAAGTSTFYTYTFTPTANTGETGNLKRSVNGVVTVPSGTSSLDIYLNTNAITPAPPTYPTVQLSRFILYQVIPS